jgi:hypothetical protein
VKWPSPCSGNKVALVAARSLETTNGPDIGLGQIRLGCSPRYKWRNSVFFPLLHLHYASISHITDDNPEQISILIAFALSVDDIHPWLGT